MSKLSVVLVGLVLCAASLEASTVVNCEYDGGVGHVSHYNGPAGLGQWGQFGPSLSTGDSDPNTGLFYPPTYGIGGSTIAGAFAFRVFDTGCLPANATVTDITMNVTVWSPAPMQLRAFKYDNTGENSISVTPGVYPAGMFCTVHYPEGATIVQQPTWSNACYTISGSEIDGNGVHHLGPTLTHDEFYAAYFGLWAVQRLDVCAGQVGCVPSNIYMGEWRLYVQAIVP